MEVIKIPLDELMWLRRFVGEPGSVLSLFLYPRGGLLFGLKGHIRF